MVLMAPAGPFLHYWPLEQLQQGQGSSHVGPVVQAFNRRGWPWTVGAASAGYAVTSPQPCWLKRSG